jgi:bacillolysin
MPSRRRAILSMLSSSLSLAAPVLAAAATPAGDDRAKAVSLAVRSIEQAAGAPLTVSRSPVNGLVTFLSVPSGHAVPVGRSSDDAPARALAFLDEHGRAFGLAGAGAVRVERAKSDELGLQHVRVRQMHGGVPVTAGELMVHLSAKGVVAVNGETLDGLAGIGVTPLVSAEQAAATVRELLARRRGISEAALSEPRLEVFNRGLLESRSQPTRLAWFVEATGPALRRFVWVDALRGSVLLDFSQLPHALSRRIHTANSGSTLPGTLIRNEGGPATGDADADAAYDFAGDTYNYYFTQHGRDSYNGAGAVLVSTVHFCDPGECPYANAFWNGVQMVYGEDFSLADDVVAHELTHAVTENEANLFYYMQSGALNESYSDIFGEAVDLTNGRGDDSPGVRWALFEDLPGFPPLRNMMDPTLFGDPGKMSDPQFACLDPGGDAGGVHSNSGVPNHAFALMVDGGTYNGVTVTAIGLTKAAKIQYRALTNYLVSGSDFLDNNNLLRQSCTDLIGTSGITAADCTEVGDALTAVQMPSPWPCTPAQGVVPALCPIANTLNTLFFDNFEAGFANWSIHAPTGDNVWGGAAFFATSPPNHLWGKDDGNSAPDDSAVFLTTPRGVPAGARLQFNHSYGFESNATTNFDGGTFEYSTNGGANWVQAGDLITAGAGYGGTISPDYGNPLGNLSGFVRDSWGYTASQLDLSSLAGQNVQFRFRIGTDNSIGDLGWFVDDFRLYTCTPPQPPAISISDVAVVEGNGGTTSAVLTARLSNPFNLTVSASFATQNGTAAAGTDYVAASGTLTFAPGATTATTSVTVNGDTTVEGNETLFVNLSGPVNGTIGDGQGEVRIMDDELSKFYTLVPCRVADTRTPTGPSGAPALGANQTRNFPASGICGIPADAKAIAINITVVGPTEVGNLRAYAAGAPPVLASTINFSTGRNRANSAIIPLGALGQMAVVVDMAPGSTGYTHFLFDVTGYFR